MAPEGCTAHGHLPRHPLLQGCDVQEAPPRSVAKGAFDEAAADAKFEKWMSEKAAKISAKTQKLTGEKEKSEKARLAAEKEANEKKAKAIEAKAEAAAAAAAQTEEAEAPAEGEAPAAE